MKVFSFLRSPSKAAMDSPTKPGSSGVGAQRPVFRDKDMGAIHKAASEGNVRKVEQILLFRKSGLNDRDRMSRTALHVACGKGCPKVVRLLIRRHCLLNLRDIDNKTALIHAIQYEQEECATILLDHGADPNVMDIHGNTALHYAVLGHDTAIVEKLLSCKADMEARNKDDFTPLSLAKYENKEKMMEFLVTRGSSVGHMERKQQLTLEYKEERPIRSSESSNLGMQLRNSEGPQEAYNLSNNATDLQESPKQALSKTKSKTVHEISEEDSLCRPRIIDSCCTSDHEVLKFEGKMKQKSSKKEASGTMCDADDDSDSIGLSLQSNSEHTDNQQPRDEINKNTVIFVNKVEEKKEQKSSKKEVSETMCNADDDSDSGDSDQTDKQQVSIMKHEDYDRFTLEEEKEERQKVDLLYVKNRVQLRKNEEHSIKEVEMNPYHETTIRTREVVSETVRENEVAEEQNYTQSQLSQEQNTRIIQDGILTKHLCKPKKIEISLKKMNSEVSENSDQEKSLLHENRLLWDEIAKLRLEIDTVKNQSQEMGKKYFEDIAIVKEENDLLHKTIRETVFQHNVQLEVLRAENTELSCKLENEQQNRGRLEAEVESYRSRLATPVQDHEHCQTSKRDLQLAFQRERDEWFCLRDKINFDVSNLKQNNKILSKQLSKAESKISRLETELHRTRDALKERTLVLEKDLSQKQCQKEEQVYEEEQGKLDKDIGKQESLQERLSDLQRENMLLHQQLDQARSKVDREEKTVINIQDQILDKINIFKAESVKQIINLKESINELINEGHHFEERMHKYENDNVERDAIVRQLQEELAVMRQLQPKISVIEPSLEIESHHPVLLQDKTHDLKKELRQSRSQSQHEKEEYNKYIDLKVFLQQRLQQVVNKKDDLEKEMSRLKELLKVRRKKLNECDNEELSFPGDSKPSPANMEIQSKKPKQKNGELIAKLQPASTKCIRLDEEKTPQQQLAVEALLKRREELKDRVKKAKQETVNLRTHMETNMVESCELREYKKKTEERARQEVADTVEQVNSLLKAQRTSQETSEQMINNHASMMSHLEQRNKEQKSEISKVQTSQDEIKREVEKYVRLYQEQLEGTKLLENKLTDFPRTKERLAEVSNKLLLEKQLNTILMNKIKSTPGENLGIPTSRPHTSTYRRMWQAYRETLTGEMKEDQTVEQRSGHLSGRPSGRPSGIWRKYEEILTRELKDGVSKLGAESYRAFPVASISQSSSSQDLLLKTQKEYKEILLKNYMI